MTQKQAAPVRAKTIADLGEFGLIDVIARMLPAADPRLVVGIGDDAAAFRPTPGLLTLATCDIQVEGRHFRRERIAPRQLGRRSAAVNLSDIAAMGGTPTWALVSLALPASTEVRWVEDLYEGLREEFAAYGAKVIGGNLSSAADGIAIDITVLGEVREEHLLRRSGARPGDLVLATGSFGASAIGRLALDRGLDAGRPEVARVVSRHLTPAPRVREGAAIGASRLATAMIDVSDGLAADLGHVCEMSGVGALLLAERVPIAPETRAVARELGVDALRQALHGGEDYELLFTCPAPAAAALAEAVSQATGAPVTQIGAITHGPARTLALPDGGEEPLGGGWDHFRKGE